MWNVEKQSCDQRQDQAWSSLDRRTALTGAGAAAAMLSLPSASAAATEKLHQPAAMRADARLLRQVYDTLHPGLLRYNTPGSMAARFAAFEESVTRPLSTRDLYLRLSHLLATIRCGHTYANFYNQSDAVRAALFEASDRLPFEFLWVGDKMIVTRDPFGTGIAIGSEVRAINGRPSGSILAALLPLARTDGHNDAKRRRLMSMQGEDRYESFDVFFSLLFGRDRYRLEIRDPDGRRRTTMISAVSLAERRGAMRATKAGAENEPVWTIERRQGAAVLTMPSWALYDSKWDWRTWLNTEVDRLIADRVPKLIVDLRGNEGGQDCGNLLVARLIERTVPVTEVHRLVRYQSLPADLRPHLDTWDRSWDDWGAAARPYDARFHELVGPDWGVEMIEPKGPRYTGEVDVLVGPQNSSATFQFAGLVQRARLARLVGEPTGGNRRGINGGCFYFVRLPETGLEADLPVIGFFSNTPQPDEGVTPDVIVPVTAMQIATGQDEQLKSCLA